MIPLKKPEFDLLSFHQLSKKINTNPNEFGYLIREKSKDSTVVYLDKLFHLEEVLGDSECDLSNVKLLLKYLKDSIEHGHKLREIRLIQSHHPSIKQIADDFSSSLKDLAKEFDKCP